MIFTPPVHGSLLFGPTQISYLLVPVPEHSSPHELTALQRKVTVPDFSVNGATGDTTPGTAGFVTVQQGKVLQLSV
jgi:hypothetical protein